MCQQLIQDREEWRGREVAMHRKMDGLQARIRDHGSDSTELQDKVEKMAKVIKEQDHQINDHLSTRQQILRRMDCPVANAGCQTELMDDQSQRIIAAESVASVGINEARTIKVECQQLKRKLARLEAANTRANEACAAYKSGCETLQEEIEHLSKEVSVVRQEHQADRQQLLTQLRASEQRERDLHASMNAIRSRDVSVEEARREVERLGSKDIEILRSENQVLKEETRAMIETSLEVREQKEKYQERYVALMKTLQKMREQADEHRRLASEDIQALNHENAEIFDDYNRIRKERQEVRLQLTEAEKKIGTLINEKIARHAADKTDVGMATSPANNTNTTITTIDPADSIRAASPTNREFQLEAELAAQSAQVNTLSRELKDSKQRLQQSDTTGASLTKMLEQENERLRDELRTQRREDGSGSGDASLVKLVENLERDNTFLRNELEGRASNSLSRSPRHDSPGGPHSVTPNGTPMTRLQALASQSDLNIKNLPPPPGHPHHPMHSLHEVPSLQGETQPTVANLQRILLTWGSCLNKLVKKTAHVLKNANMMRRYLAENSVGSPPEEDGLPIFKQDKYPNEAWNKVFEALSGIKFCVADSETKCMGLVARNVVFQKKITQLLHGPEQPQAMEAALPHPQESPAHEHPSNPFEMMDHSADTDSTDSSIPGEDLDHCTQLIYDTDALLRASQGADMFWGDGRIEYLKDELRKLQEGGIEDLSAVLDPQPVLQGVGMPLPGNVSPGGALNDPGHINVHAPVLPANVQEGGGGGGVMGGGGEHTPRAVSPQGGGGGGGGGKRYVSSHKTMRWADPSTSNSFIM